MKSNATTPILKQYEYSLIGLLNFLELSVRLMGRFVINLERASTITAKFNQCSV